MARIRLLLALITGANSIRRVLEETEPAGNKGVRSILARTKEMKTKSQDRQTKSLMITDVSASTSTRYGRRIRAAWSGKEFRQELPYIVAGLLSVRPTVRVRAEAEDSVRTEYRFDYTMQQRPYPMLPRQY